MASNSILAKLAVLISANNAEFNKKLSESQKGITNFSNNIKQIAGAIGLAFGVKQIASFAFEAAKLAGEAEAVSIAFDRLPNSTALMNNLKEATGNTVSELNLMKRAVQASNFDISLEALPKLLEFATLRAQQTGQSVDYLVDSIVTGIGRKSKLILDNLGISAVQLNEALGGASTAAASIGEVADAVGKIAEDNLKGMAGFSENAATSVQRLDAAWEELTISVGKFLNKSGFPKAVAEIADVFKFFAGDFSVTKKEATEAIRQLYALREAAKQAGNQPEVIRLTQYIADLASSYGFVKDKAVETIDVQEDYVATLEKLKAEQSELNLVFETTDLSDKKQLKNIADKIIAIGEQIKAIESLKKAQKSIDFNLEGLGFFDVPEVDTEALKSAFDNLGAPIPITFEIDAESTESLDKEVDAIRERWAANAELLTQSISDIGNAFQSAISGQQSFAQALGNLTLDIIDKYLKQALAAAIAKSIQSGGPLPVGLALAAASIGIVKGLFNKAVGRSGGGSGGSSSSVRDSRPSVSGSSQDTQMTIVLKGELRGQDIFLAGQKYLEQKRGTRG
jgi:hypothetical protein